MTDRDVAFLNVLFVLSRNDEPRAPKDIAEPMRCSHQAATAALGRLRKARLVTQDRRRPTGRGVRMLRRHFSEWGDVFSDEDERKALAA